MGIPHEYTNIYIYMHKTRSKILMTDSIHHMSFEVLRMYWGYMCKNYVGTCYSNPAGLLEVLGYKGHW